MIGWSGDELNFIVLRFVLLRLVLASVSHYSLFEGREMQHSMLDLYVRPYATRRYSGSKTKGMWSIYMESIIKSVVYWGAPIRALA